VRNARTVQTRSNARSRSPFRGKHRDFWPHVAIASPLAIALIVVGLVFGLGKHTSSPGCSMMPVAHAAASHHAHEARCPFQQAGMFGK
jgi:hypothetical protein